MFPEFRDLISRLKTTDAHFQRKFDLHNQLDDEISQLEKEYASDNQVRELKKQKLKLKEELFEMLKTYSTRDMSQQ
ncbi:MAG: YdcH family protein [Aeromonas sp.]